MVTLAPAPDTKIESHLYKIPLVSYNRKYNKTFRAYNIAYRLDYAVNRYLMPRGSPLDNVHGSGIRTLGYPYCTTWYYRNHIQWNNTRGPWTCNVHSSTPLRSHELRGQFHDAPQMVLLLGDDWLPFLKCIAVASEVQWIDHNEVYSNHFFVYVSQFSVESLKGNDQIFWVGPILWRQFSHEGSSCPAKMRKF